ncbi:MAG: hypothetical protein V2A73_03770, partial [Pseudomonadota bacterium]
FIGVPCHRRAADCCGENSTSKEEWNKELGTRNKGPGTARPTAFVHTHGGAHATSTSVLVAVPIRRLGQSATLRPVYAGVSRSVNGLAVLGPLSLVPSSLFNSDDDEGN